MAIKNILKPSPIAISELKEKKKEIVKTFPLDRPGCLCETYIRERIARKEMSLFECPEVKKRKLKKYFIVCDNCKEKLAYFHSDTPSLDNYFDLHYMCWYDKESWHGCLTINRNPNTLELNFECACGHKEIREPSLNNVERYTKWQIIPKV